MIRRGRALFIVGILAIMTGCTSKSAVFKDRSPEQVWAAMVSVAEEPDYGTWVVVENNVWVDSVYDRLEIQRKLKRDLRRPEIGTVRESQDLEMQVVLERTEPPAITVTIRNWMLRGKAVMAIDQYFGEIRDVLDMKEAEQQVSAFDVE